MLSDRWFPVAVFVVVATVVVTVSQLAYATLAPAVYRLPVPQVQLPPRLGWLGAWTWWDGAWYVDIARRGYSFSVGPQSPVAFFPAYPLLMRALATVVVHPALAGFLVTLVAGLASVVLFHRWCRLRLDRRRSGLALAALSVYPCSFYLVGTVYADALFLAASLGAFLLVERDRPVPAALIAAVATATRPTGLALVVGLWLRARERHNARIAADRAKGHDPGTRGRPRWLALAFAPAGFLAYAVYLGVRFGNPLAFAEAERGWGQAPGLETWLKFGWFTRMQTNPFFNALHYHLIGSAIVTVLAIALLPAIFRRFGPAYGAFTTLMIVGTALSTRDFIGMGRYVLVAFPCFAAAGDRLADSPRLARIGLGLSAAFLVFFTQLHARNMLIS